MRLKIFLLLAGGLFFITNFGYCQERVIFGFEEDVPNWEIPEWCFEKEDYVGESVAVSNKFFKEGKSSLELMVDFPPNPQKQWRGAYVEVQQFFDWIPYRNISVDVFLPENAPYGLKGKIILAVGEQWTWTEMSHKVNLVPGEWTTVSADISIGSSDWRKTQVTEEFLIEVRKLGVRIESDRTKDYSGPVYIDNVRLE